MRNESISLQHLHSHGRISGALADSSDCQVQLGEEGVQAESTFLTGLIWRPSCPLCQRCTKAVLGSYSCCKGRFYRLSGSSFSSRSCLFPFQMREQRWIIHSWDNQTTVRKRIYGRLNLLFFTLNKFQIKTEENSRGCIKVVNALPNKASNL